MTLRNKIAEAAFWHEAICLTCGCRDELPQFVEATCDCAEGDELIVDAIAIQAVLARLEVESESGPEGN